MIMRNSAICLTCNEEIESRHRHDFVRCSCGNVAVDGGKDYLKRSVMPGSPYKDTSVFREEGKNDRARKV